MFTEPGDPFKKEGNKRKRAFSFLPLFYFFLSTAKKDAIGIYTPERPYTMYVGTLGEKKIWLQNLKQTIQTNLHGKNTKEALDVGKLTFYDMEMSTCRTPSLLLLD